MSTQMPEMSKDNIRVLYGAVVQQRQHWAMMINTIMGFVVTINVGIWAYLFAEFIKSGGLRPGFILIGGAISAATIAGWRLYTRYLDNNIASLYSAILYYEKTLGVPDNMGINNYLVKSSSKVREMLLDQSHIAAEEAKVVVQSLYQGRQLGPRGHEAFERLSVAYIAILMFTEIMAIVYCWNSIHFSSLQDYINVFAYVTCFIITVACLFVLRFRKWQWQMQPKSQQNKD